MSNTSQDIALTSDAFDEVSLLDILDHVLNSGVIIHGNLVISLAGVDLVYVGLDVILSSVGTAFRHMSTKPPPPGKPR